MTGNQKIKILYLMKILLENTDDERGMTLEEITNALSSYGIDAERKTLYSDFETLRVYGLDMWSGKYVVVVMWSAMPSDFCSQCESGGVCIVALVKAIVKRFRG